MCDETALPQASFLKPSVCCSSAVLLLPLSLSLPAPETAAPPAPHAAKNPPSYVPMVAVIFLDIDGVICCNMAGRLEESKLAVLNQVCKATQAKVVLSTDWRRQAQLKRQVIAALKRLDIEVIGATPMRAMFQPIRPQEIMEWYNQNHQKFGIDKWVAIDDRDLLNEMGGPELTGHMCRTHPNTGLTKRLGDVCIEILGGNAAGTEVPEELSKQGRLGTPGNAPSSAAAAAMSATAPARTRSPATRTPLTKSGVPGFSAASSDPANQLACGGGGGGGSPGGAKQQRQPMAAAPGAAPPVVPASFATNAAAAASQMSSTAPASAASPSGNAFSGPAASRAVSGARSTTPKGGTRGGRAAGAPAPLTPGSKRTGPASSPATGGGGRRAQSPSAAARRGGPLSPPQLDS